MLMRTISRRGWLALGAALALVATTGCDRTPPTAPEAVSEGNLVAALESDGLEYADVMNQGGVGVYQAQGSSVARQPNGLRIGMSVPTPAPGTYVYPAGAVAGHPEVFTLWAFVFNYPENCTDPCNGDDLGFATGANGGVYNVGGHAVSGAALTIAGRIGVGEQPVAFAPLESPETAEIHVALAPHGVLDPTTLPGEFRSPAGSPVCGCWWVSIF